MKFKTRAILGIIVTIIIGIIGLTSYSSGGYMEFLGIQLKPSLFIVIILVFIIYDISMIRNAIKNETQFTETMSDVQTQVTTATPLETPGIVTITRLPSMLGAAMGVSVFLNGKEAGILKNNQTLNLNTDVAENELTVRFDADGATNSIKFNTKSGETVKISLKYLGAKLAIEK